MNLRLERRLYRPDGIFSDLEDENGKAIAVTLEHSYLNAEGNFRPKIPDGVYTCKRSPHRLHGMSSDFITFQVMDVPGHDNILFHWGNYNADSDGCVLLGKSIAFLSGMKMITRSKESFADFMLREAGLDTFQLTVVS